MDVVAKPILYILSTFPFNIYEIFVVQIWVKREITEEGCVKAAQGPLIDTKNPGE